MTTTFVTRTADRWDLLAQDIYNLSSLGWAIAEANPSLAGVLILDGGITINIPAIETLRQPLVSVNPARADTSTGFVTPPGTASPTPPPTPTPGAVVFPIAISQGGTDAINSSQALTNLGAIATNQIGVTVAPLVSGLVPAANLPAYPTLSSLGAIPTSAIGVTVAPIVSGLVPTANLPAYPTLSSLGAIPTSAIGTTIAPLTSGVVPSTNLPAYPTLSSLGAIPTSAIGVIVAPLVSGLVPTANLPAYPTLSSLGAIPTSAIGVTVAPLTSGLVPTANLPAYPTLSSLGAIPTSAIGTTVAPLVSGLVPTANLPPFQSPLTFPLSIAQGGTGNASAWLLEPPSNLAILDANLLVFNQFAGSKWINSNASHVNFPLQYGIVSQFDSLFGSVFASKYRVQEFMFSNRWWKRQEANSVWGTWFELSFLNNAQTFTGLKEFNSGLFATNSTPKIDVQNTGLTKSSQYFANPSQTTGQRNARLNYASNGNLQLQILSDDGATVLFVWEFTASGNMLIPGVMRFAGYTSNPTGASFVPGGIYYHSTLKRLVMSDGTNWYQLALGAQVT